MLKFQISLMFLACSKQSFIKSLKQNLSCVLGSNHLNSGMEILIFCCFMLLFLIYSK